MNTSSPLDYVSSAFRTLFGHQRNAHSTGEFFLLVRKTGHVPPFITSQWVVTSEHTTKGAKLFYATGALDGGILQCHDTILRSIERTTKAILEE